MGRQTLLKGVISLLTASQIFAISSQNIQPTSERGNDATKLVRFEMQDEPRQHEPSSPASTPTYVREAISFLVKHDIGNPENEEPSSYFELVVKRKNDGITHWAFPLPRTTPSASTILRLMSEASRDVQRGRSTQPAVLAEKRLKTDPSYTWAIALAVCLAFCFAVCIAHARSSGTSGLADPRGHIGVARGRDCWAIVYGFLMISLCWLAFGLSMVLATNFNSRLEWMKTHKSPRTGFEDYSDVEEFDDPESRGFEASAGLSITIMVSCMTVCSWRKFGDVQISRGLLCYFAVRGALQSTIIALLIEIFAKVIIIVSLAPKNVLVYVGAHILLMCVVGLAEESSKAWAVMWGTWFRLSALEAEGAPDCCQRCWRSLLETPRALMLAGMSVGFGFATLENAGYLVSVALEPGIKNESRIVEQFARIVVIFFRTIMNLHPWLSGIAAGRMALVVFKQNRNTTSLSTGEFCWCIGPSALIHGVYDIAVMITPGPMIVLMPCIAFATSYTYFDHEWNKLRELETESARVSTTGRRRTVLEEQYAVDPFLNQTGAYPQQAGHDHPSASGSDESAAPAG